MSSEFTKGFIDELIKDTSFVKASEGSLMGSRMKVTTPLYAINCIYGGGIPLSMIVRISGHPGGGKSTFSYQCMANYQKEYPDGVPVIYDMEASMDNSRLNVLGIDTENVLRLPATSLESAFSSMFDLLNKLSSKIKDYPNLTSFQIYDTISTGGTDKQHEATSKGESAFGAGPMMENNRIIKQNLINLFPYIEKFPVFIGLLEQVFTQINSYGGASYGASKNFGLDHASHIHLSFGAPKDDKMNGFLIGTESMVTLKKSKLSPKFEDIPCYIDVTQGGKIDEVESFIRYISNPNIGIIKVSSWWSMAHTIDKIKEDYPDVSDSISDFSKSYRKDDMKNLIRENKDLLNLLQIRFIDYINNIYPGQKEINSEYREKLIEECCYLSGQK